MVDEYDKALMRHRCSECYRKIETVGRDREQSWRVRAAGIDGKCSDCARGIPEGGNRAMAAVALLEDEVATLMQMRAVVLNYLGDGKPIEAIRWLKDGRGSHGSETVQVRRGIGAGPPTQWPGERQTS